MRRLTLLLTLVLICNVLHAQNTNKCGTTELVQKELRNNPDYVIGQEKALQQNAKWIAQNKGVKKSVTTLPVVVHIVHKQSHNLGIGTNIPDIQIEDALKIINEDYSKTNAEFPNPPRNTFLQYAGNANLEFCLATTDPNGAPTNGVIRTPTTKNNFDKDTEGDDMKRSSTDGADGWPPSKYINIWVCDIVNSGSGQILGYAYKPGLPSWNAWKDGLVIDFRYFGTVGNASSNDGTTPTHELGHYLGLSHTFCEQTNAQGDYICCDNDDDNFGGFVDDTPAVKDIYYGPVNASTNNNTCNDLSYANAFTTDVLDMDENFMSYAEGPWMFTNDQIDVMNATLNGYRSALKNSTVSVNCSGIVGVGINDIQNINSIDIYPNPSDGLLSIRTNENIEKVQLLDLLGNIVYTEYTSNNTLDLSAFSKGVYFVHISTTQRESTHKILLSH